MINKERIEKIKAEFFGKGLDISTTDIGYAVLSNVMGDNLAYEAIFGGKVTDCLLYTSPSPRDS